MSDSSDATPAVSLSASDAAAAESNAESSAGAASSAVALNSEPSAAASDSSSSAPSASSPSKKLSSISELSVNSDPHNHAGRTASPPPSGAPTPSTPSSSYSSSSAQTPSSRHRAASAVPAPSSPLSSSSSSHVPASPSGRSTRSSSDVSFRRQLQSIRASDLEAEHQIWTHAYTLEEAYWSKQEERFNALLKRAQTAAGSSRDLHGYLRRSAKLLSGLSEQLGSLGSFGVNTESGSMRVACDCIDIVRRSTGTYLNELQARVFADSLRQVAAVADSTQKILTSIETAGSDMLRVLKNQRKSCVEAWLSYFNASKERTRSENMQQKLKSDPFLLARTYEGELYALQTQEVKFQQLMTSLLKDLQVEDTNRLRILKNILMDNLTAQKAVYNNTLQFTENALTAVKQINPENDVQEFVLNAQLVLAPESTAAASSSTPVTPSAAATVAKLEPQLSAAHLETEKAATQLASQLPTIAFLLPPPVRDPFTLARVYAHEIEKEGLLFRQGNIIRSNWKPMHAVVTSSGFLHLYEEKNVRSRVHTSYNLSEATVENGESAHSLAMALKFQKTGFTLGSNSTIIYFKAENADELMEWSMFMQKHQLQAPQATLTLAAHNEQAASTAANA